jgi:hypothetical protein
MDYSVWINLNRQVGALADGEKIGNGKLLTSLKKLQVILDRFISSI